jgi:hypothetical protein
MKVGDAWCRKKGSVFSTRGLAARGVILSCWREKRRKGRVVLPERGLRR